MPTSPIWGLNSRHQESNALLTELAKGPQGTSGLGDSGNLLSILPTFPQDFCLRTGRLEYMGKQ